MLDGVYQLIGSFVYLLLYAEQVVGLSEVFLQKKKRSFTPCFTPKHTTNMLYSEFSLPKTVCCKTVQFAVFGKT